MSILTAPPQAVEMPSKNKDYPGNSLLVSSTVKDEVFDGTQEEINARIDSCVQEVLTHAKTSWKRYALVGLLFINRKRDLKTFIDIDAKSISKGLLARQYTYKVVARG